MVLQWSSAPKNDSSVSCVDFGLKLIVSVNETVLTEMLELKRLNLLFSALISDTIKHIKQNTLRESTHPSCKLHLTGIMDAKILQDP